VEAQFHRSSSRRNEVRSAGDREEIVECHLVRQVNGCQAQAPFVTVTVEQVVMASSGKDQNIYVSYGSPQPSLQVEGENSGMVNLELPQGMYDDLRAAWQSYVDLTSPFRPDLHRYCRRLTHDLWDAEDLVQETLLRAFAALGSMNGTIQNPRGYLVRTATPFSQKSHPH
jgi:hypothetical protein